MSVYSDVFLVSLFGSVFGTLAVCSCLFIKIREIANRIMKFKKDIDVLEEKVITLQIQVKALHAQFYFNPHNND